MKELITVTVADLDILQEEEGTILKDKEVS